MDLQKVGVKFYVRFCEEESYSTKDFEGTGVDIKAWPFPDGDPPSDVIIDGWLDLVDSVFVDKKSGGDGGGAAIGCHCVAGLGRAPVMVAIALIENGLDWQNAVDLIRKKR